MTLNYFKEGEVKVDMKDYVKNMIEVFEKEHQLTERKVFSSSNHHLFDVDKESPSLDSKKAEKFHSMIAKALFASKRARPDILLTVSVLCTRVKDANEFE